MDRKVGNTSVRGFSVRIRAQIQERIFDTIRADIDAVHRWKYEPQSTEIEPADRRDVRVRLTFEIEK